jgi:hypothetical protein
MPILALEERLTSSGRTRRRVVTEGFRESGGEILTVASARGDTLFVAPVATVVGAVWEAESNRPLANATVVVQGTRYRATSDDTGRFEILGFLDGEYQVAFSHARTKQLRYVPDGTLVTLNRGDTADVALTLPGPDGVFAGVCGDSVADRRMSRGIVGRVTRPGSLAPVRGARVRVFWQVGEARTVEALRAGGALAVRNQQAESSTDSDGFYQLCGVPSSEMLIVVADLQTSWSTPTIVLFEPDGVWHTPTPCLDQTVGQLARAEASWLNDPTGRARCYATREFVPTSDWLWRQDLPLANGLP